jgi:hypothetical protein
MGIDTSAFRGDLTGQGAGTAWKARGTFTGVGIVSSSLRHGSLTGAASGLASKAKGTHKRCGDRHVRLPPFSRVDRLVIQLPS